MIWLGTCICGGVAGGANDGVGEGIMVGSALSGCCAPSVACRSGATRLVVSGSDDMFYSPEVVKTFKDYLVLIGF